ncbi:MAG TPA: tRNA (adenosine(37)-N6)-threonylcarbamoyltransferase complex transferase subunit TsaD [Syntrophorhabdaceae bacterium]|nr:tRNA (adenosine(37)-N6)-threonylcarbamoyltransferase complex transferase subunit TsaD [Syntrophorhabdaceae bacterium]
MLILGIDTSCDDTSLAILDHERRIRADIVSSQVDVHAAFGGVVPEIASRKHVERIDSLFDTVLREAEVSPDALDLIAVTNGPGLIGSVLIGLSFAKGLSLALHKPLIGVNHVEAHAMSVFLERKIEFPFIALVVSGGHTVILLVEEACSFKVLGTTRDDAAGEAFDKIAKYLGLGYPGGKIIETYARQGRADYVSFPRPMIDDDTYDFSFSGLKTAFITYTKKNSVDQSNLAHVLASFQQAAFDVLAHKTLKAASDNGVKRIVVGGGVAANGALREIFARMGVKGGIETFFSSPRFCTDNGAMIASLGYSYFQKGIISSLDIKGYSRMSLRKPSC